MGDHYKFHRFNGMVAAIVNNRDHQSLIVFALIVISFNFRLTDIFDSLLLADSPRDSRASPSPGSRSGAAEFNRYPPNYSTPIKTRVPLPDGGSQCETSPINKAETPTNDDTTTERNDSRESGRSHGDSTNSRRGESEPKPKVRRCLNRRRSHRYHLVDSSPHPYLLSLSVFITLFRLVN